MSASRLLLAAVIILATACAEDRNRPPLAPTPVPFNYVGGWVEFLDIVTCRPIMTPLRCDLINPRRHTVLRVSQEASGDIRASLSFGSEIAQLVNASIDADHRLR